MKIQISGEQDVQGFSSQYVFMSLAFVPEGGLEPKSFTDKEGTTTTKMTEDGQVQLRTSLKCLRLEDGVPVREEQNVSLAVVRQPKGGLAAGEMYFLAPPIDITHYTTNNNRLGVSIVANGLVPVRKN